MGQQITRRNYLKYLITVIAAGAGVAVGYGLKELTGRPIETPTLTQTLTQPVTQTVSQTVTERTTKTQPITQTVSQTVTERTTVTQPATTVIQTVSQTVTERKTETLTKTVTEIATVTQTATHTVTSTQTVIQTTTKQMATIPPGPISYKIELDRERCNKCQYCIRADRFHFELGDQEKPKVKGGTISNGKSIGYFTDERLYNALLVANTCRVRAVTVTGL